MTCGWQDSAPLPGWGTPRPRSPAGLPCQCVGSTSLSGPSVGSCHCWRLSFLWRAGTSSETRSTAECQARQAGSSAGSSVAGAVRRGLGAQSRDGAEDGFIADETQQVCGPIRGWCENIQPRTTGQRVESAQRQEAGRSRCGPEGPSPV